MKPLLFLDVDGVLNARVTPYLEYVVTLETPTIPQNPFTNVFDGDTVDLTVCFNRNLSAWLAELSEVYELMWATTWENNANTHLSSLLGLGELGVVEFAQPTDSQEALEQAAEWKWDNLLKYAGERPFVFVDDQAYQIAEKYPLSRGESPAALWISYGLKRGHVDLLLAFCDELKD